MGKKQAKRNARGKVHKNKYRPRDYEADRRASLERHANYYRRKGIGP